AISRPVALHRLGIGLEFRGDWNSRAHETRAQESDHYRHEQGAGYALHCWFLMFRASGAFCLLWPTERFPAKQESRNVLLEEALSLRAAAYALTPLRRARLGTNR